MAYTPTLASVRTHPLPDWFDDAKLGVFLHWGLYSVPGWAPQVPDIQTIFRDHGPTWFFRNNPYAEWYLNSLSIDGSPTRAHHDTTYGAGFPYDGFVGPFEEASGGADLDGLAATCARAGARYVVLTTKHHDGYCLWPSAVDNPHKPGYHSPRDLVGDLSAAVRAQGMRMGLYYSGGFDWTFAGLPIRTGADALLATPQGDDYVAYVDAQYRELVDRFEPSVLWNDIGMPAGCDLPALWSHYYDRVAEGAINDRWAQGRIPGAPRTEPLLRGAASVVEAGWRFLPERYRTFTTPPPRHADFTTPEYARHDRIVRPKWETTRGVGHSFGANRNERAEDVLTTTDLVRSFVDTVSKNGNLLIGIGPQPDGTVPDWQVAPLAGLGDWLAVNGDAVFGTRPWTVAETTTTEGAPVRLTMAGDGAAVHATVLETPATPTLSFRHLDATAVDDVRVLGIDGPASWSVGDGGALTVELPDRLPVSPALAVRLSPAPRWAGPAPS